MPIKIKELKQLIKREKKVIKLLNKFYKAVLISIQPKWVAKIASGEKTIEVRKTAPKCEVPFKCYIYCTSSDVHSALVVGDGNAKPIHCCNYKSAIPVGGIIGNGKVIGEFICDKVYEIVNGKSSFFCNGATRSETNLVATQSCLDFCDMAAYLGDKNGYGWHISDLKIYDKPKELSEFRKPCKINLPMCDRCEYYSTWNGRCENITRAPQSYQYVEEL